MKSKSYHIYIYLFTVNFVLSGIGNINERLGKGLINLYPYQNNNNNNNNDNSSPLDKTINMKGEGRYN